MKREASVALPLFLGISSELDWLEDLWLENLNPPQSLTAKTKEDSAFEWMVWTLVFLSLLLAVLGGTLVVRGVMQFDFPLVR